MRSIKEFKILFYCFDNLNYSDRRTTAKSKKVFKAEIKKTLKMFSFKRFDQVLLYPTLYVLRNMNNEGQYDNKT